MSKFSEFDVAEMLGITPISQISDKDIWRYLVTPMIKGLLGPVVRTEPPRVMETTKGMFPGDEATNLNDHRLYGGQSGYVRYPYIYSSYKTEYGALIIKRDFVKVEVIAWQGDVDKGKGEMIFKAGLRDRRFDGTRRADDCALVDYSYADPVLHKQLAPGELKSVELSIYGFTPGSRVLDVTGEDEYENFVRNPFTFLDRPDLFRQYFDRAWKSKRAPGQVSSPIADVSKLVASALERLARAKGYDVVEGAASHYHVGRWLLSEGYQFFDATQAKTFKDFSDGLERIRAAGQPLNRIQQSWVCVVQSLRPVEKIPAGLFLDGPIWPQDNISNDCLWLFKPISDKGKAYFNKPAKP